MGLFAYLFNSFSVYPLLIHPQILYQKYKYTHYVFCSFHFTLRLTLILGVSLLLTLIRHLRTKGENLMTGSIAQPFSKIQDLEI